jgi:hypothetical protein
MLGSLSSYFAELNPGEPQLAPEHQSRVSYCFHVRMGFDEGQAVCTCCTASAMTIERSVDQDSGV